MSAPVTGEVPAGTFELTGIQAGLAAAGGVGGAPGGDGGDERRGGVDKIGGMDESEESSESESGEEKKKRETGKMIIPCTNSSTKSFLQFVLLNALMYSLCCLLCNFRSSTRYFHCHAIRIFSLRSRIIADCLH